MDFVLVHGSYHGAWCWDLLTPELERLGHRVISMDLPISDPGLGAAEYAEADRGRPPAGERACPRRAFDELAWSSRWWRPGGLSAG